MTRLRPLILGCMILALGTAATLGAEKAAPPKTDAGPLVAVVRAVIGTVETRPAKDQPWVPVTVGMTLAEGADIRTGFRARCILDMTDSLVQVDPLTVIRIGELRQEGQTVRTRLYMKHGNTQAVVEKGKIESDFAIITPSATLSVPGTKGIKAGFYPVLGGSYGLAGSGLIAVRDTMLGRQTNCGQGESTNDNATNPLQVLAQLSHVDADPPGAPGRRAAEHRLDDGRPGDRGWRRRPHPPRVPRRQYDSSSSGRRGTRIEGPTDSATAA